MNESVSYERGGRSLRQQFSKLPLLIMRPQDVEIMPESKAAESTAEEGEKAGEEIVVVETTEVQVETWSDLS